VPSPLERTLEPKASRIRVWQAADRILQSGRRPTVEGVRELLGGGSPNSVTTYINDWYQHLGTRLVTAETPLAGFPSEAVSLMTELWRLAAKDQGGSDADSVAETTSRILAAERDALEAEAKSLQTLNQELARHRATAEKSLAEARALLARREAALEDERARTAGLDQALAQTGLELEVLHERRRIAPSRARPGVAATRPRPNTPPKRRRASKERRPKMPVRPPRKSAKVPAQQKRTKTRPNLRR
jgi:hypothetical protein